MLAITRAFAGLSSTLNGMSAELARWQHSTNRASGKMSEVHCVPKCSRARGASAGTQLEPRSGIDAPRCSNPVLAKGLCSIHVCGDSLGVLSGGRARRPVDGCAAWSAVRR